MWISKLLPVIIWSQVCLKQVWANTMYSRVNNPKMKKIVSKNFPISLIVILEPFHAKRCAPNEEFCNLKMCAVSKAGITLLLSKKLSNINSWSETDIKIWNNIMNGLWKTKKMATSTLRLKDILRFRYEHPLKCKKS